MTPEIDELLRRATPEQVAAAMKRMTRPQRERLRVAHERRSFAAFVRAAWHLIDPRQLVWNWHIDAMCLHLEALADGEIDQLIINIPPGFAKSMIVGVLYPCWRWTRTPSWQLIAGSAAERNVKRDSAKRRQLIETEWFRTRHAKDWELAADQNQVTNFSNTKRGHMVGVTVGGAVTGARCDCLILDDPIDAGEIYSDAAIEHVNHFTDAVASTRFNDAMRNENVLVMQRLKDNDPTAHALEQGGWTHLRLPAEFEADDPCVTYRKDGSLLWRDPRTAEGELLFPARYPRAALEKQKRKLADEYAGQYQQRPTAKGGGIFRIENWRFWKPDGVGGEGRHPRPRGCWDGPAAPVDIAELDDMLISVDATFRETKTGSFVAMHVWGRLGSRRLLLDRVHERMDFYDTVLALKRLIAKWPWCRRKLIEGKANGDAIISTLTREHGIAGIEPVDPGSASKEQRARAASAYHRAGNVELPDGAPWLAEYIGEHTEFPRGKHDDDVDAQSQALLGFETDAGGALDYVYLDP